MMNLKKIALSTLFASAVSIAAPLEVMVPVEHVYAPTGFDSNDRTEIVVEGHLPDLCHKYPMAKSSIKGNVIDITITSMKYFPKRSQCASMVVPFLEVVDVGILKEGKYEVLVNGRSIHAKSASISIGKSNSNIIDDHVYAGVEYIQKSESSDSRVIALVGYNPSYCYELEDIQFISNKKDTLSILPKMKQVAEFCPMKMTPFYFEVEVPRGIQKRKVLLHARATGGKSVNAIFENSEE